MVLINPSMRECELSKLNRSYYYLIHIQSLSFKNICKEIPVMHQCGWTTITNRVVSVSIWNLLFLAHGNPACPDSLSVQTSACLDSVPVQSSCLSRLPSRPDSLHVQSSCLTRLPSCPDSVHVQTLCMSRLSACPMGKGVQQHHCTNPSFNLPHRHNGDESISRGQGLVHSDHWDVF